MRDQVSPEEWQARPDVGCIIHTHTRAGMAVSCMRDGLLPLTQTSMRFYNHIGYHDYEGPAVDKAEQERLVADVGEHNALVLRNHGLLTCGPSVAESFNLIYQIEQSCRAQVDVMAAGASISMPDEETLAYAAKLYQPGTRRPYGFLEWPAMLRLLDADRGNGWPQYDS